jgi:DNA-binding NtrC family response regulator
VQSVPDEGTIFSLLLPLWREPTLQKEEGIALSNSRGGKVLILDDDEGIRRLLARLLEGNHEVEEEEDGRKILADFAPGKYDVLLVDLGMAEMAGDRLARAIRLRDPLASMVLITGWELSSEDPRLQDFDFHLQKPFDDLDEVENVVAQAIELHDQRVETGITLPASGEAAEDHSAHRDPD